jgi:hypothetical protein
MPDSATISISLAQDEALVLFELAIRLKSAGNLLAGEVPVLNAIECQLERVLAEPFLSNYLELVAAARSRLTTD